MNFYDKLNRAWSSSQSSLCVGLDPDLTKIPGILKNEAKPLFAFNKAIIDATAEFACAFKPQFAYYAGQNRVDELLLTFEYLRENYPHIVTILDSKRGDIGTTAKMYAREAFEVFGADSVTVNPYMGGDTLAPFTDYTDRGVIVLCRTSNPGSGELQNLETNGIPLYETVAKHAHGSWNQNNNLALVVGATYPDELARVRQLAPELPLLVPGVGAQGGNLAAVLRNGRTANGQGLLINSSRGIIYAGSGNDFADHAHTAAQTLVTQMRALA